MLYTLQPTVGYLPALPPAVTAICIVCIYVCMLQVYVRTGILSSYLTERKPFYLSFDSLSLSLSFSLYFSFLRQVATLSFKRETTLHFRLIVGVMSSRRSSDRLHFTPPMDFTAHARWQKTLRLAANISENDKIAILLLSVGWLRDDDPRSVSLSKQTSRTRHN